MNTIDKWIFTALAFAVVFVLGFVLSRAEKPYPMAAFTVHKLLALAVLVFLIVTLLHENKANELSSLLFIAVVLSAVLFLGTIITGGLVSVEKPMPEFVFILHRWLPWLTVLSTAAVGFLVLRGAA